MAESLTPTTVFKCLADETRVRATRGGFFVLDAVVADLAA